MAKYINSDSIIKGMIKYQFESQNSPMTKYDFVDELLCDDIIEVVRCENCKHWVTTAENFIAPYCEKIGIKYDNGYRDFDDFCSYGERKESK